MRSKLFVIALGLVAVFALGGFAAGCGDDDETTGTAAESGESSGEADEAADETSAETTANGAGKPLAIEMGEFYYKPDQVKAKAGRVTIDANNVGDSPHELVLAKTDDAPDALPTKSDGSVDEAGLDVPGEVEAIDGGTEGRVTIELKPGKYVMFCNLPGHYKSGMYGSLTVR